MITHSRFSTLADWLAWQEQLHPRKIDLGLERVRIVAQRLGLDRPAGTVIAVGGTNGKGSCVALLEAMLRAAGYRVGTYTSPHLRRYNERICIEGRVAADTDLCDSFARIDGARGNVSLTYFEFGTLAALDLFQRAGLQAAVLEVGMGGRLDAVNVVDADAALITAIALDHTDWLGPDRDSIGREKAAIYRPGRPAVCADPAPPASVLDHAAAIGAQLYRVGADYGFQRTGDTWNWWQGATRFEHLPLPALAGEHQVANAAAVLMVLQALASRLPVPAVAIATGLIGVELPARFQIVPGPVEWIFDVAHNPHSAAALARVLRERPCTGNTRAVIGMLADKDATSVARALDAAIDGWYAAGLQGLRGRTGTDLAQALRAAGIHGTVIDFPGVMEACTAAAGEAAPGDRILVFGSFLTVAQALEGGAGGVASQL